MEKLFDETFACESEGNSHASRNIWYGYIELYEDSEYGKEILLGDDVIEMIYEIVKGNLAEDSKPSPNETNWYIYGKTVTQDAIEDTIRPTIMVREKRGEFLVHCNISDNDFATNIDKIVLFKAKLEKCLMGR